MSNSVYKISLYSQAGVFIENIDIGIVENFESIRFGGNIGSGQGALDLTIITDYDNSIFSDFQLVELSEYNENNVLGKLLYSGYIKNINRNIDVEKGNYIELELLGLGSILGEYSGTFNTTGNLNTLISSFITQFHSVYNISNQMEFIGNNLFKNNISSTTSVTINKTGTYFEILSAIFLNANKTFFINSLGELRSGDESIDEHIFTLNNDIVSFKISSSRETEIIVSGSDYNISPGDNIYIQNINSNFNLSGEKIEKVEYSFKETRLYTGKIWSLGSLISGK